MWNGQREGSRPFSTVRPPPDPIGESADSRKGDLRKSDTPSLARSSSICRKSPTQIATGPTTARSAKPTAL